MKILHVISGLEDGGAEGALFRLTTADTANVHTVVSLMGAGKYGAMLGKQGVEVECLQMPAGKLTMTGISRLRRLIVERKPDIVQTWMYHADLLGGLAAKTTGVRAIAWNIRQSTFDGRRSKLSTRVVARACAVLSPYVPSRIVTCSAKAMRAHVDLGYAKNKFVLIPNGYDLVRLSPDRNARPKLRKEWGIDEQSFLLGMVARFHPQKDHETLLAALAANRRRGRELRCVMVGHGMTPDNKQLSERIVHYGLEHQVVLLGQREDIAQVMTAIDLHILSSAFGEAFPNVVAEAMACGTPCVVTDVGDAAAIVGESGWVVPPRDAEAIADAVEHAIELSADRRAWDDYQQKSRERIYSNFSLERMVAEYGKLWASLAG